MEDHEEEQESPKSFLESCSKDIIGYIMSFLEAEGVLALGKTSKKMFLISTSEAVWRTLVQRVFGVAKDSFFDKERTYMSVFMEESAFKKRKTRKTLFGCISQFGARSLSGDIAGVRCLLRSGADVNQKDGFGQSVLNFACSFGRSHIDIVQLLVLKGADVNLQDASGWFPLLKAVSCNSLEAVRILLDGGADVNQDFCAWTSLHDAAYAGYQDIARLLLERGARVNQRCSEGRTALYYSCEQGRDELTKMLLQHGADSSVLNEEGCTNVARLLEKRQILDDGKERSVKIFLK